MATKILMPKLSDTMTEGIILKWHKKEGEKVKQGEILVEIESDKADMELEAYDTGILRKIVVPEKSKAPIGSLIAIIGEEKEDISYLLIETPTTQMQVENKKFPPPTPTPTEEKERIIADKSRQKISPVAKKIAEEKKVSVSQIEGSGPKGRIIKRDIESFIATEGFIAVPPPPSMKTGIPPIESDLSLIRKTIAKRMHESKTSVPHFYVTMEIDVDRLIVFREELKKISDLKISFTDILLKASASALMKHPYVNGTYLGDRIRFNNFVHIGVAAALDEGLVTPVVRNCNAKGIGQIHTELRDLVERARFRKLKPEEYQGATFTISNLGMFGVDEFIAIINPPESSILAIGAILEKPVIKNSTIVAGSTMKITLSADHRIVDGAVAARFLQDLKLVLENPASLAL